MSTTAGQKRKRQPTSERSSLRSRKNKRAAAYHSSSEDEEADGPLDVEGEVVAEDDSAHSEDDGITLPNLTSTDEKVISNENGLSTTQDDSDGDSPSDADSASSDNSDSASTSGARQVKKRNDPARLATSISSILSSKLTTTQRSDPILARSAAASQASKEVSESRLDAKARRKMRDDKRAAKERGRVKDVLGLEDVKVSTAAVAEEEKRLRKMAQRGVVKLFNAVRAAQVKGEQAAREAGGLVPGGTQTGVVGADRRKERVNEMSKKGFLDLLAGGAA